MEQQKPNTHELERQDTAQRLLYSYESAARLLNVSPEGVRGWCRRGLVRVVRVGSLPRIPHEELERIAREGIGATKGAA